MNGSDKTGAYFDNAATTPLLPQAEAAILGSVNNFANPSSLHSAGLRAEKILSGARETLLSALGSKNPKDTAIFCGSGTEANNLAILGTARSKRFFAGKRIIISDSEHPSIYRCTEVLESEGFDVVRIASKGGAIDIEAFNKAMSKDTFLVSVMTVNNETGAVYDIKGLVKLAKAVNPGVIFHTDATQAFMKVPFSVNDIQADLITVSAHKIGGCKGVGALYIKEEIIRKKALIPVIFGGGQENGFRSGTENTLGIAAFAAAVEYRRKNLTEDIGKMGALREYIISSLKDAEVKINTAPVYSPAIISVTLPGIKSEVMLHFLSAESIFVSGGSACSSHHPGISRAMTAFGLTDKEADCTIRISLSPENTEEEANELLKVLKTGISSLIRAR